MESGRSPWRIRGRFVRFVRCRPYHRKNIFWRWIPSCAVSRTGRADWPYMKLVLLGRLKPGFLIRRWRIHFCVTPQWHWSDAEGAWTVREGYGGGGESKINHDKSPGLRLGAWRGIALSGLFSWTNGPVRILGEWFVPKLRPKKKWSEVQVKVWALLRRWLSFLLSFTDCQYFISLMIVWGRCRANYSSCCSGRRPNIQQRGLYTASVSWGAGNVARG